MCIYCQAAGLSTSEQSYFHPPVEAGSSNVSTYRTTFTGSDQPNMLALISGQKWNGNTFTYSFPTSTSQYSNAPATYGSGELVNGFAALNAAQISAVRYAYDLISQYTPLTFSEITGNPGSADMRFAGSNSPNTAWAYYPSNSGEGGDSFYNVSNGYYTNPVRGTYAWHTFMHEVGHAMGLKHGHDPSGNGALATSVDQMAYSVMTYKSYQGASGSNYTNEYWGYAQTYMAYDIAALQALYGVNWQTNNTDTTYTWSSTTGEMFINGVGQGAPGSNRIFSTIWDGNGNDTIDLSNFGGGMDIDLRPGGALSFSAIQTAQLGAGIFADGNVYLALAPENRKKAYIENIIGGSGNDTITGNTGHNMIDGKGKNDFINGLGGHDTIFGGGGKDTIIGGPGDDIIDGGIGKDDIKGNGGADIFILNDRSGKDIIKDFTIGEDLIDVPDNALATLKISNTNHLTVEYLGSELILRHLDWGDATLNELLLT